MDIAHIALAAAAAFVGAFAGVIIGTYAGRGLAKLVDMCRSSGND